MKKLISVLLSIATVAVMLSVAITAFAQTKPPAPTGVRASVVSSSKIKVSWSKTARASGYYVRYSTSENGTYKSIKVKNGTAVSKTITKLGCNTRYYIKVAAFNSGGVSKDSTIVSKTTTTSNIYQKQQYNTQCAKFNFTDTQFAYSKDKCLYYSKDMDSPAKKLVTSSLYDIDMISINGDYIYYVDYFKEGIFRIKTDGTSKKKLVDCYAVGDNDCYEISYINTGKYLYYAIGNEFDSYYDVDDRGAISNYTLYRCNLDGSGRKKITNKISSLDLRFYKGKLYMISGSKLGIYNESKNSFTTKALSKSLTDAQLVLIDRGKLVFAKRTSDWDGYYFYKIDIGSNFAVSTVSYARGLDPVYSVLAYKDKCYILTSFGDGCDIAKIASNHTAEYRYSKRYTVLGNYVGFYKNYICGYDYYNGYGSKDFKFAKLVKVN